LKENTPNIDQLLSEIDALKSQLYEANSIVDAIREGAVDALVVNKDGQPHVFSIETADYTYRILIEKFGEGALSITDDGLILYCNDYFSKLIGIPANQITGTFFTDYVDSEDAFTELLSNLNSGSSKSEIVLNANGKKLHVYVSLSDLHPNVAAIGVVVTDLTEKRKHEEALVQYQRELELKVLELNQTNTNLEQFIHVISHDLKEPIRKVLMYTSHLHESKSEHLAEKELASLDVINSSAVRLNSLVDDLVKYAFSATKDEVHQVNLNGIFKDVKDDIELIISENNADISSENLPEINGSKVQMRQLFSNLIINAIKYRKADVNPVIKITADIVDGIYEVDLSRKFHKISIHDNGIGMDNSHLAKIFTIFQRLHMRNEYSGNGIGLAICKKIMENHNGLIKVESIIGKGSIFNLYFPIGTL